MAISTKCEPGLKDLNVVINNVNLEIANDIKYLGFVLESKLNSSHVYCITMKMNKKCVLLSKL